MQEVSGGSGLFSQNSLVAQFGLGSTTSIDSLIVRWPSGIRQVVTPPPSVRTVVTVTETGFGDIGAGLAGVSWCSAAWGDYDSDGDLDMVMTGGTETGPSTRLYRNDEAEFDEVSAGLPGVWGGAVAWGDYDRDGDLDLLLTGDTQSGYLSRVYRNDGGSFTDIGAGLPGVIGNPAAWGDYDNDGDLDILLCGWDGSAHIARVYRNDDGTFHDIGAGLAGVSSQTTYQAWGDYDNDGDLDLFLTGGSDPVSISRIYRNDAGTFVDVEAGLPGVGYCSGAWGDYDGDGYLDLLLAGETGSGEYLTRLYHSDGGSFSEVAAGLPGTSHGAVAWGDFDNDGDLDIALTGYVQSGARIAAVYRNDGGSFTDSGIAMPGVIAGTVAWGDYDHDGRLDLLLAGHTSQAVNISRIYRNNTPIANTPPTAPASLSALLLGDQVTFNWNPSADDQTPPPGLSYNLRVGTTPGGSEVCAPMASAAGGYRRVVQLGNAQQRTSWTLNLPSGSDTLYWSVQGIDGAFAGSPFAAEQTVVPPFTEIGVELPGVNYSSAAWGDYDQDDDLDILLTGWGGDSLGSLSRVYRNDDGTFVDGNAGLPACNGGAAAWGDYDSDGDLDILLVGDTGSGLISRIYRNDTVDGFQYVATDLPGVRDAAVAWGDYDNDGDLDILLSGSTGSGSISRVYRNDGAGHFVEIDAGLPDVSNSAVAWGDYDRDGDLDILLAGSVEFGDITAIYRNDAGSFVLDADAGAPLAVVHGGTVAWGDYNSDGRLDILLTGYCDGVNVSRVYRNDGPGFTDIGAQLAGVWAGAAAWGDYDNDGDLDILLSGMTSPGTAVVTKVYRNDGGAIPSETFSDIGAGLPGACQGSAGWADYDRDSDLDILLTGWTGAEYIARVYRNNAPTANTPPESPQNLEIQELADSLRFSWSPTTDAQTPAAGLTYNLRVGTTPGGCDLMPPLASAVTGYRHVVQMGNAQQDTSWAISHLAGSSSVYWSVQAIDGAFAGSAFAPEAALLRAGACCWPEGWCNVEIPTYCPEQAIWQGAGTSCDPNPCPGFFVVRPDGTGDYATIQEAIDAAGTGSIIELTNGTFTGDGNRDLNYYGKAITVRSQSGSPDSCIIACESDLDFAHRGVTFESGEDSTSVLSGITITGGLDWSAGGAISIHDSGPLIHNCVFSDNSAGVDGEGGGAIALWRAQPVVSGCVFSNNSGARGGAVYSFEASQPSFFGCTFFANNGYWGSAIWNSWSSSLSMENCIIVFGSSTPIVCQIDLKKETRVDPVLSCTNIYGHPDGDWVECLAGQETLRNNLSADPLFCSMDLGDLGLMPESPCAPANSPACGLVGARPVGCTPRPDLLIESIAPDSAQAGQELSLTVTIRNQGTELAGASKTLVYVNGSPSCPEIDTPPIPAGEAVQVLCPIGSFSPGEYPVEVSADVTNLVVESSEQNNWLWGSLVIGEASGIADGPPPRETALLGIVPNPFAGTTAIQYALAEACPVDMRIFDAAGRQVRSLRGGSEKAGLRTMVWNGRDDSGIQAGSGTYYLRFVTPRRTWTRPIVLLR
jgi:hypothetical protein